LCCWANKKGQKRKKGLVNKGQRKATRGGGEREREMLKMEPKKRGTVAWTKRAPTNAKGGHRNSHERKE